MSDEEGERLKAEGCETEGFCKLSFCFCFQNKSSKKIDCSLLKAATELLKPVNVGKIIIHCIMKHLVTRCFKQVIFLTILFCFYVGLLQAQIIRTVAGSSSFGDGGAAIIANLNNPTGVAIDGTGNIYIAEYGNNVIRKVNTSGIISTVVGNYTQGYGGDGGAATSANLNDPVGVALDGAGNIYIADQQNNRIRKVSTSGVISTVAGNGTSGYGGDGGAATSAILNSPSGVAIDRVGNIYIADVENSLIRKVNTSGVISTVAGNGIQGYGGDGGVATSASLAEPSSVFVDGAGNIYIADRSNDRIRKVSTSGVISTVAGNGTNGYGGDGGLATSALLNSPVGIALDGAGNMYIADNGNHVIRKVNANGIISTVAGNNIQGNDGDGGLATNASMTYPNGVAVDGSGNFYIADNTNLIIRKVNTSGIISTVAGDGLISYGGDGGAATSAQLYAPTGVAVDGARNIYIADYGNSRIRKVNTSGIISTIAGNGIDGYSGDGGAAASAQLYAPTGVALDGVGNIYIADVGNSTIRKINTSGIISTLVGNSGEGFGGDGGLATNANLSYPSCVFVDGAKNIYIVDEGNNRIRKINTSGIISTVAGNGTNGYGGDGGLATNAILNSPAGVALDGAGNIYIADAGNNRIRKVNTSGIISTVVGNGIEGFGGDGGVATSAILNSPDGISVDGAGNIYIADVGNGRIRKVNTNGIISTLSGNSMPSFGGDGGLATNASLTSPSGVFVDGTGNVYIADQGNNRIREIIVSSPPTITSFTPTTASTSTTVTFTGTGFTGATTVSFGGVAAISFTVVSATSITAVVGSGASGSVSVTTGNGTGSLAGFIYNKTFAPGNFSYTTPDIFKVGTVITPFSPIAVTVGAITTLANRTALLSNPFGLAVDPAENVYVAVAGALKKIATDGTVSIIRSGFYAPAGVALDAAGNLYGSDLGVATLYKIATDGTFSIIGAGIGSVYGIAVDAVGNVYVGDWDNNAVKKIATNGTITILGSGFSHPYGIAVDAAGNVYVGDYSHNAVKKIATDGTVTTLGSGFYVPSGVAVDIAGNVYVADYGNNLVKKIATDGSITILGSGFSAPTYVAVDAAGNVYVGDNANGAVKKIAAAGGVASSYSISPALPAGLVLNTNTGVITGTPTVASAATNYTITATNAAGSSSFSLLMSITVPPTITSFTPTTANTGTIVSISGTNFIGVTSVSFGGVAATSFTVVSATNITAFVGAGASGSVSVTTGGGTASLAGFNYNSLPTTWAGTFSSDWSTNNNWSNGILPTAFSNILIPSAPTNQPVLSKAVAVNAIEIYGNLSINGQILTINGAVTGGGSLKGTPSSSLVIGGSAGNLLFDANKNNLGNLTITGSATLGNALNVIGTLTSTSGTLTTGGYLTLKSTSITNSAVVAPVTGTISGNVTVERYIPAGYRGYRDITPQVYGAGTLYKNWQENGSAPNGYGLFVTGATAYANSSNAGATDASGFDKSKTVSTNTQDYNYANGGWVAFSNTNATNLDAFLGYRLLIRGDRAFNLYTTSIMSYPAGTLMVGATTLRATGNLVYGTVTYSKTGVAVTGGSTASSSYQLNSSVGANTGFNLIANPYVSPVLWGTGSGSQSATATVYGASNAASVGGINGTYWFLDPTLGSTGFYRAYNALTGSSVYTNSNNSTSSGKAGYQYIQSGQAFFVQNASSSPKVVFLETTKAAASTKVAVFGETTTPLSKLYISLAKETNGVYTIVDGAALVFDNGFSNAAYGVQDGLKFNNASDNLSINDKGISLSIDGRMPATSTDKVALAIGNPSGSNYQLVLDASSYISNGFAPSLYDAYTKTTTAIGLGAVTIDFTIDSSVSASNVNRFSILFLSSALSVKSIVASASLRDKVVTISWNTIGESGVSAFDVEKSVDRLKFATISQVDAKNTAIATYNSTDNSLNSTSYYRIKVISTNGSISYSNVAKLTASNAQFVTVYPNPLNGKSFNVSMENLATGKYAVSIYNVLGEKMIEQTIVHEEGSASCSLTINKKLVAGIYTVAIREATSNKVVGKTTLLVQP